MKIEPPCSPGHCLGMLNDNMRTDLLRGVHQGVEARMDHRGKKSPLVMLIESIEEVLAAVKGGQLPAHLGPNPFNTTPGYRFQPTPDFRHDLRLLTSQLRSLREIRASLGRF